jgi:methylmalonyl-CoA mutase N-terminal domain/subunit
VAAARWRGSSGCGRSATAQVTRTLRALADAARGTGNLMEPIMEAVMAYETLGH